MWLSYSVHYSSNSSNSCRCRFLRYWPQSKGMPSFTSSVYEQLSDWGSRSYRRLRKWLCVPEEEGEVTVAQVARMKARLLAESHDLQTLRHAFVWTQEVQRLERLESAAKREYEAVKRLLDVNIEADSPLAERTAIMMAVLRYCDAASLHTASLVCLEWRRLVHLAPATWRRAWQEACRFVLGPELCHWRLPSLVQF